MSTHQDATNRFGAALARRLDTGVAELPYGVAERLQFSRRQALAAARARLLVSQRATATEGLAVNSVGSKLATAGMGSGGHRFGAVNRVLGFVLPALLLFVGLWWIQNANLDGQLRAVADVDTALLSDDLPPNAYADPGFLEFLKDPRPTGE